MNGWRTANGKVTINRSSEEEINKAIADLEKRGYVLVEKRPGTKGFEEYNEHSRKRAMVFATRWIAEMKKGGSK